MNIKGWKNRAHRHFDPIWSKHKIMSRSEAYMWLSVQMGIGYKDCHISLFNIKECKQVIEICKEYLKDKIETCE